MKTEQREAGRALDAETVERAMGWSWTMNECEAPSLNDGRCRRPDGAIVHDFRPSRDIAAAFLVVAAMRGGKPTRLVQITSKISWIGKTEYLYYSVEFRDCDEPWATGYAESETLPLAICLAALKALDASPSSSAVDTPSSAVSQEASNG